MVEMKHFGRKNSMIIFYLISSFGCLFIYLFGNSPTSFIVWATFSKTTLQMTCIFCFQYTSEVYPTKYRTTGIGIANGVGRLGTILMPWVFVGMSNRSLLTPFTVCFFFALFAGISSTLLPYDTRGIELDLQNDENIKVY